MKKVLLLAVAICLVAAPAFAISSIVGSKHDLSLASGPAGAFKDTAGAPGTEVCVFCHTPHGAVAGGPLWNRSVAGGVAATDLYNSVTLDAAVTKPAVVLAEVNLSDAKLCLSCHDEAAVAGALVNVSNADGAPTLTGDFDLLMGDIGDATGGTSLTNDHPIGMVYADVVTNDPVGFKAAPALPFFGTNSVMWCSSCHDVHDNTNAPFLNVTNVASGLCTTCHDK